MFRKKTPLAWARSLAACACVGLTLLSACSDDDSKDPADTDLPSVTITGLTANAVVAKTVTVNVKANDNDAIQKVEVKLDGTVALTKTESSFSYELNTTTLEEGTHTFTVIVTDAAGNQKTEEFTFTVQNALITINVPAEHLRNGQKGYVYLSDSEGELIVSAALENGKTARLMAPTYTGSDFLLTEVIIQSASTWWFRTFPNVTRGTWVVSPRSVPWAPFAGGTTLNFTNALPETEYTVHSDWDFVTVNENTTKTIDQYKNPAKLYITRKEEDVYATHYLLTDPISINTTTTIDLSKVTNELTRESYDIGDHGYTEWNAQVAGIVTPGDYFNSYLVDNVDWQESNREIRYPGNAFPAYYTTGNFYGDNFVAANYVDGLLDTEPLAVNFANVQLSDKITGSITGNDVDYAEITILYEGGSQWTIVSPKGTLDIPSPFPPEEILEQINAGSEPTILAAAVQKFDFDGYDGLIEYIRSSDYGAAELYFFGATFKRVDTELTAAVGRKSKHENLKRITQQLGRRPGR